MSEYSSDRVHRTTVGRWGKRTLKQRVFGKVVVNFSTSCWEWTASLDNRGYGQVCVAGRPVKAHRVVFEIYNGSIPAGLTLDHLCRNVRCVNPEHLEPTTRSENTRRQFEIAGHPRSRATHCFRGHALTADNLRNAPRPGRRICRSCVNENNRRYRSRKKAAA